MGCTVPSCAFFTKEKGPAEIARIEERWNSDDPQDDLVTLKDGRKWENVGMKAEIVGRVTGEKGMTAFLFSALNCVECEPDLLLTIHATTGEEVFAYPFPGKLTRLDLPTGIAAKIPHQEVRGFYGKCSSEFTEETILILEKDSQEEVAGRELLRLTDKGLIAQHTKILPQEIAAFRPPSECHEISPQDREVE